MLVRDVGVLLAESGETLYVKRRRWKERETFSKSYVFPFISFFLSFLVFNLFLLIFSIIFIYFFYLFYKVHLPLTKFGHITV